MRKLIQGFLAISVMLIATGCNRCCDQVWDDTVSCGRYMNRGFQSLCGNYEDSRQVQSRDDFWYSDDDMYAYHPDFMPFMDDADNGSLAMSDLPPSKFSPGDPGSKVPGIEAFIDPAFDNSLSAVYRPVHFEYNSNNIKGQENIQILANIAQYMKQHPHLHIFVEGHCDERGPEAYNLALGTRRSNEVRNILIKEGVNPDNIFTVSYGKERLLAFGKDDASHRMNRRAEFRVYSTQNQSTYVKN